MTYIPPIREGIDERHSNCYDNGMICDPDRAIMGSVVVPNDLARNRFSPAAPAVKFILDTYERHSFMVDDIARGTGFTIDYVEPALGRFFDDGLLEMLESDCPFNVYRHFDKRTGLVTPRPLFLFKKIEDEQLDPVPRSIGLLERLRLLGNSERIPTIGWV